MGIARPQEEGLAPALGLAALPPMVRIMIGASLPYVIRHPDGSPYITRYLLWGSPALGDDGHDKDQAHSAFIHLLHTPDPDRDLHDHPWAWGFSLILSGGYVEKRYGGAGTSHLKRYRAGDRNSLEPGEYHSLVSVEPNTATLFIAGREIQDWGFLLPDDKWVDHRTYLAARPANGFTHTKGA